MPCVPQVVFLNCCHLGFIERTDRGAWAPALWSSRSTVAANLATEFIRMGARVVIAAGWAVDDGAARFFATSVYEQMLDGRQPFGRAITEARRRTYHRYPRVNTWGAYQCYGDPHFALAAPETVDAIRPPHPMTAGELVIELETVALQAVEPGADRVGLRRQAAGLTAGLPDEWLTQGEVREAMGQASLALEEPTRALAHLDEAMRLDRQSASINAIGEFSVAQTARAAVLARAGRSRRQAQALLDAGRQRLEWLLALGETPGRLAWLATATRHALALARTASERVERLETLSRYARRAEALARRHAGEADPGLLLDWAYADLARQLARGRSRMPAALLARVARAHRLASTRFERTRLSSDALVVADALAARHLMRGDLAAAGPDIVRAYRQVRDAEVGDGGAGSVRLELLAAGLPAGERGPRAARRTRDAAIL